ncbi:MAG: restriction endonuclease [Desulfobaccales bacterium]
MPYLRFSRAKYSYSCALCSGPIAKALPYFRDEPHPFARMRGQAKTRQICLTCVLGRKTAHEFLDSLADKRQLPLGFELNRNGFLKFPPRVELVDISPQILHLLSEEPERLRDATPAFFEDLICNRLEAMGYNFERVGASVFGKDGGVDILAWPRANVVPCLMAVQVKHTALINRKMGPQPVRDLLGAVHTHGFNVGLLVTNTTFTPDALWVAEKRPFLIRLRDFEDLRKWLKDDFLQEHEWRDLPSQIELCPGVFIKLPK